MNGKLPYEAPTLVLCEQIKDITAGTIQRISGAVGA